MSASAETIGSVAVVDRRRSDRPTGTEQHGAAASQEAAAPHRAGGVELLGEVPGSGYRRPPALVRRADGQTIQLTPLLYHLVEAIDGKRGYPELAAALSERVGKLATADDVRFLTEAKLRPLGLLRQPDGSEPQVKRANPLLALRLKLVVSNPNVTRRLTAPFAALFHPVVAIPVVLAFVLAIYFLVEGDKTYAWLLAYVPPSRRDKVHETIIEARALMIAYVAGNIATSAFAGLFVLVTLHYLNVPSRLLLALLAAICDFIPVLGFVISAVPALLIAATVSGTTVWLVAVAYVACHLIENYLIGPRVYGTRLKLSNIAVIVALFVGAAIGGVVGALVALPFAAAYPAVERIWLADYLGRRVVQDHERLLEDRQDDDVSLRQ